jgi:hypothetical protein
MINNQSLSFEAIKADLIAFVQAKPDNQKWKDFTSTGAGTTVIELLATVSTYKAFQDLVERRERYLGTAQFKTSIQELAFNRGYMQAPTLAATITVTFNPVTDGSITIGDIIGTYGVYQLIAYENKTYLTGVINTILCVVGNLHVATNSVSGIPDFQQYTYTFSDTYIASQLEMLLVDSTPVDLLSELNYLRTVDGNFFLRRVVDNAVKIYSGNGVVGYTNSLASSMSYRCVTYGTVGLDSNLSIDLDVTVTGWEFSSSPSYNLSTEELRATAIYYPLDGRIVQDRDYESIIMKYFGGVLVDVRSYNTDPNQEIELLVESTLGSTKLLEIQALVDSKRGQGIQVFYTQRVLSAGYSLTLNFTLPSYYFTNENVALVRSYLDGLYLNRFFKESTIISSFELSVDITKRYSFPLYANSDQRLTFAAGDWVKEITVNIVSQ